MTTANDETQIVDFEDGRVDPAAIVEIIERAIKVLDADGIVYGDVPDGIEPLDVIRELRGLVGYLHRQADPHCTCNDCIDYEQRHAADELATMNAAVALLQSKGIAAHVDFPGIIRAGSGWTFGTANGCWQGDLADDNGRVLDTVDLTLPVGANAQAIADAISDVLGAVR